MLSADEMVEEKEVKRVEKREQEKVNPKVDWSDCCTAVLLVY
jgi:hypothetical protein